MNNLHFQSSFAQESLALMSFWPSVYQRIINQEKLLEYRRRFPKNCNYSFVYTSSPIKSITGIINFENIYDLDHLIGLYDSNLDLKIIEHKKRYQFVAPIKAIQRIEPITLKSLRSNVPGFTAPQSFLYIDNYPDLKQYLFENIAYIGEPIENKLADIIKNNI